MKTVTIDALSFVESVVNSLPELNHDTLLWFALLFRCRERDNQAHLTDLAKHMPINRMTTEHTYDYQKRYNLTVPLFMKGLSFSFADYCSVRMLIKAVENRMGIYSDRDRVSQRPLWYQTEEMNQEVRKADCHIVSYQVVNFIEACRELLNEIDSGTFFSAIATIRMDDDIFSDNDTSTYLIEELYKRLGADDMVYLFGSNWETDLAFARITNGQLD